MLVLECCNNDRFMRLQMIAWAVQAGNMGDDVLKAARKYSCFINGCCGAEDSPNPPTTEQSMPADSVSASDELQATRNRKLGLRVRRRWGMILVYGERYGLSDEQIRGAVEANWLGADDAKRKQIAASLGFDWEGAADFFAEVAPIIIEMMAACGI